MIVVAAGTIVRQVVLFLGVLLLVDGPEGVLWVPICEAFGLLCVVSGEQ